MNQRLINRKTLLLISFLTVLIDQLSKDFIRQNLKTGLSSTLIPGLLKIRLVMNTGAAFSLFTNATPFLGLLSFTVAIGLIVWISRLSTPPFWQGLSLALLLGGTIGNGLDRWRLGHVTDFLELVPIHFPIFNVADIAINMALIFLCIDLITNRKKDLVS